MIVKLFRVAYLVEGGQSGGFTWLSSLAAATRAAKEGAVEGEQEPTIEEHTVKLTKGGVLAFLNTYASHADNG